MNSFTPKTAPFMGLPAHMSIADIPPRGNNDGVKVIDALSVTTLSAATELNARGVEIHVSFAASNGSCSLELYKVDGSDVLIRRFDGVTQSNNVFYLGNNERVDLEGKPIKVKIVNPLNGAVTVVVKLLY